MAGFGNTFDSLWTIGVLDASIGVTIPALHQFGLTGLLVFPGAVMVFGFVAYGAYSRLMKPQVRFTPTEDRPEMNHDVVHVVARPPLYTYPKRPASF